MALKLCEGQIEINGLCDRIGGLDVEGDAGEDAERTEMNGSTVESVGIFVSRQVQKVAAGRYELESRDGGREVAVVEP